MQHETGFKMPLVHERFQLSFLTTIEKKILRNYYTCKCM